MGFPLLPIIGAVQGALKLGSGLFQNSKANEIDPQYNPYQVSQPVKDQYGIAQQMFNGRMPGALDAERNIGESQANYVNNASRATTDSGQLLALGGLAQGQSNNAYNQLGINEAQDKYSRFNMLQSAGQDLTDENDKVYQDMMQKYQMDMKQKSDLRSSAWQNIFGGVGDFGSAFASMQKPKSKATANVGYGGE